jgi:hypothetical protein
VIGPHRHPSSDYYRGTFLIGGLHSGMNPEGAKEALLFVFFDAGQHCIKIRQVNHFNVPAVVGVKLDGPIHFSPPMLMYARLTRPATIADRSATLPLQL